MLAVLTGDDVAADGLGGIPCGWLVKSKDGSPMMEPPHPLLAQGKVALRRRSGRRGHRRDPGAGQGRGRGWSRSTTSRCRPSPASTTRSDDGAPLVHDESRTTPVFDWHIGDKAATDAAFARAAHVTTIDLANNRLVPNAIEPRAAIGDYDAGTESYTLYTTAQNPHVDRLLMARLRARLPEHKLRVVAPDVGGGFGSKIFHLRRGVRRRLGREQGRAGR